MNKISCLYFEERNHFDPSNRIAMRFDTWNTTSIRKKMFRNKSYRVDVISLYFSSLPAKRIYRSLSRWGNWRYIFKPVQLIKDWLFLGGDTSR